MIGDYPIWTYTSFCMGCPEINQSVSDRLLHKHLIQFYIQFHEKCCYELEFAFALMLLMVDTNELTSYYKSSKNTPVCSMCIKCNHKVTIADNIKYLVKCECYYGLLASRQVYIGGYGSILQKSLAFYIEWWPSCIIFNISIGKITMITNLSMYG